MRRAFGKFIAELADRDPTVVLLVGDIGYKIFDEFRYRHPGRFINMGICEQSIISISAGMALEGLKPWVYTITPFLIERPFEQVKLDINEQNVNVKLVGYADYPNLGPTHTEINAKLLMGLFPNIKSFFPKDGLDTVKSSEQASDIDGPVFISLKSDPLLSSSITSNQN
jgi:transketolase